MLPLPANAQDQTQAAADAYDRGAEAYLAESWSEAARWFEMAHRFAPAEPALTQAVRSHFQAGNIARAGTLALRLEASYGDSDRAAAVAQETLDAVTSRLVRVSVQCNECSVELEGALLEHSEFFLDPDVEHEVTARFETGERSQTVQSTAGDSVGLEFTAPPPSPGDPEEREERLPSQIEVPEEPGGGVHPAVFFTLLGLTAVSGGILIWSGVDTLAGVDDFEAMPTQEGLDEGRDKELRTNILIGVTSGFALATVIFAFITDWSGSPDETQGLRPGLHLSQTGAELSLGGTFQ
ncbi:MAG: hypothetical protein AAGF12_39600 [Myxococcota bacterium]